MNYEDSEERIEEYLQIYGVKDIGIAEIFEEVKNVPSQFNKGTNDNYDLAIGHDKTLVKVMNYDINNKKNYSNKN